MVLLSDTGRGEQVAGILDGGMERACVEAVSIALLLLKGLQVSQIHPQAPGLGYLHSRFAKIILAERENRDMLGKCSRIKPPPPQQRR